MDLNLHTTSSAIRASAGEKANSQGMIGEHHEQSLYSVRRDHFSDKKRGGR
jgi:hypothetical protein